MKPFVLPLAVALAVTGGCAAPQQPITPPPSPEDHLEQALTLLEHDDYSAAEQHLASLYHNYAGQPVGRRALFELAAAKLDPRNPDHELDAGARLLARYLRLPHGVTAEDLPVARTLYLMALDLGATPPAATPPAADSTLAALVGTPVAGAAVDSTLPTLPHPPLTAELQALRGQMEAQQAELTERIKHLEETVADRERQIAAQEKKLADKDQELRRIRRTLKP